MSEKRANVIKSAPIDDHLTEDPIIHNQKYFILSYILPSEKNELEVPMIKVRGVFRNFEEAKKKVEKLKFFDPYFNLYVCEVGKWGGLFTNSELEKNTDVDVEYREKLLNTMMKEYKENKDRVDVEFEKRKEFLRKRAEYEGSKQGQEEIAAKKEHPKAVKLRIEYVQDQLKDIAKRNTELNEILKLSEEQFNNFTEEELKQLEE